MYQPLIPLEPINMSEQDTKMRKDIAKKEKTTWSRKDYKYISKRKRFRIFSRRIGQKTDYTLANSEPGFLWNEVSAPRNSSWKYSKKGEFEYFIMLIDGVERTRQFKQKIFNPFQ